MNSVYLNYEKKLESLTSALRNLFYKKKTEKTLAIDLGPESVKIVYLEPRGKDFQVSGYAIKKIAFSEDNRRQIADFIKAFLADHNIEIREISLNISDFENVIIKHIVLPAVPKKEILQAAQWQLKEELPFDLKDAVLDWQIVKEYSEEDGARKYELGFALADSRFIDKCVSLVQSAGLSPVKISAAAFSYANIIKDFQDQAGIRSILQISRRNTFLFVYNQDKLEFIRELPYSGEKLTQSLTGALKSDKGVIELSYAEAEEILDQFGIPDDPQELLRDNLRAMQVIALMRPHLESLSGEIARTLDYFAAHFKEEKPANFYITGSGANLKNLDKYLTEQTGGKVSVLPLPDSLKIAGSGLEKSDKERSQIISALSAGLERTETPSLLPADIKARKAEYIEKAALRITGIALGAILLFSLFIVRYQIRDYQKRLKNARLNLEMTKEIKTLKHAYALRQEFIDGLHAGQVPVDGLLKVLSQIVPVDVILDSLSLDQSRHTLILKGVVLKGGQLAEAVLTGFMQEIEKSDFFTEASLLASEKTGAVQRFEIRCDLWD